jgi:predicted DNA-binding transcriptional regulator AlpA
MVREAAKGGSPRRLIRQCDIAKDLGVTPKTISRWMDRGHFPFVLIAGRRWATKELYEAWLLENTEPGVGPGG